MDLSKAFVAYLMTYLAKMKSYGFSKDCLTFLYSYLKCWKQSVNIRNVHNMFQVLFSCVTQESILRPLLFNIFIKDLFYFIKRRTTPKFCWWPLKYYRLPHEESIQSNYRNIFRTDGINWNKGHICPAHWSHGKGKILMICLIF